MKRTSAGFVTPEDVDLLSEVAREGSLAAAARAVGISRDKAIYRVHRLTVLAAAPVVVAKKGGRGHGGTRLTAAGWAILREGSEARSLPRHPARGATPLGVVIRGRFTPSPVPHVRVGPRLTLVVGFRAPPGEPVRIAIDPESVLVARRRFPTSARNVLTGRVVRLRPLPGGLVHASIGVGPVRIPSLVTPSAVRSLGLRAGSGVVVYIKASAIRRV